MLKDGPLAKVAFRKLVWRLNWVIWEAVSPFQRSNKFAQPDFGFWSRTKCACVIDFFDVKGRPPGQISVSQINLATEMGYLGGCHPV